jgi:hypothetical protein
MPMDGMRINWNYGDEYEREILVVRILCSVSDCCVSNILAKEVSMDIVDKIMLWEQGEMTGKDEVVAFFQELIDNGMAWTLQGTYGRTAKHLIDEGYCHKWKSEGWRELTEFRTRWLVRFAGG